MARPFHHPAVADLTLNGVLHALSDPVRRKLVAKLANCAELSCSGACDDLPASTVSFHHRVLREAGLIRSEKRGVQVINSLRRDDLEQRFPGLLDTILKLDCSA